MEHPTQEIQAMTACWEQLRDLSPEARTRIAWWLLDHANSQPPRRVVRLLSYNDKKINVIKAVCAVVPGLGLKEAKTLVESAPVTIHTTLDPSKVVEISRVLKDAGATTEIVTAQSQ